MRFNSDQIQKIGKEISSKVDGKTLFDEFSRGRYSTDASVYQIKPLGVVLPKDTNDVLSLMEYSQKNSVPLLARGGGSSQCGQTVGESVVLDYSKHQNKILELNVEEKYVWVQPGVVLDHLNAYLKPHGLWFPVDVSTSSRATIGGMSANNSCGSRSLYYGNMVHNVLAIEAILDDGSIFNFDQINKNYLATKNNQDRLYKIIDKFIDVRQQVGGEIDANWPTTQRRVGGYNIDLIDPEGFNSSNLLVGSEGTLSLFNKIKLFGSINKEKPKDLNNIIETSENPSRELTPEEKDMLNNVIGFGESRVEDCMVPRADIVGMEININIKEILKTFSDSNHSRIPIYKETLDNPIGMLHMKDLIGIFSDDNINEIDIEKFLREILFVPPSMKSRDLLVSMQTSRIHMALVIDEYGGTDGLVTIEDLIEEINSDKWYKLPDDNKFLMNFYKKLFELGIIPKKINI